MMYSITPSITAASNEQSLTRHGDSRSCWMTLLYGSFRARRTMAPVPSMSVSRVAWKLGDEPWWTLGGGTDAFGVGVGVSLEGADELGHLLVALDAAE